MGYFYTRTTEGNTIVYTTTPAQRGHGLMLILAEVVLFVGALLLSIRIRSTALIIVAVLLILLGILVVAPMRLKALIAYLQDKKVSETAQLGGVNKTVILK